MSECLFETVILTLTLYSFVDDLDVFVPEEEAVHPEMFGVPAGFANLLQAVPADLNARDGDPQMFWQGMVRSGRRRAGELVIDTMTVDTRYLYSIDDDGLDIFGRPRSSSAAVPEGTTHPLLLDPSNAVAPAQSRSSRRGHRGNIHGFPQELLDSIEHAIGEGAIQLFQHIIAGRGPGAGETIRIDVPASNLIPQLRHGRGGISAHIRLERAPRGGEGRSEARGFEPLLTRDRWAEEVKSLHGRFEQSRVAKIVNHVIVALLPEAVEAHKKAKALTLSVVLGLQ